MRCPNCNSDIQNSAVICENCDKTLPYADITVQLTDNQEFSQSSNSPAPADLDPKARVHNLLTQANLCRLRKQWTEAIDFCVSVLRIAPDDLAAHALLGDIYRDQGKWEDAIQWYRMTFDLGASPVDKSKLEAAEQEYAQVIARRSSRSFGSGKLPPIEEEGLAAGTVNLLGISPQRWLRGITFTSIACAILMVIGLSALPRLRHSSPPAHQSNSSPTSLNTTILPDIPASQEMPLSRSGAAGGQGFRADTPNSNSALAPAPMVANTPLGARLIPKPRTDGNIPPAPVNGAAPLPSVVGQDVTGVGEKTAFISLISRSNPLTLSNGMNVVQAIPDHRSDTVAIQIVASSTGSEDGIPSREQLVRTCFRAGKAIFDSDPTLSHAAITIVTDSSGANGESRLAVSEVDRGQIYASSPETEPSDTLEKRMTAFHLLMP